jgi:alpha-galactosidase/6-phospho-beta-glucosidase family protein
MCSTITRITCLKSARPRSENRDKAILLQLIMVDPWTQSEEQTQGLLENILALPYQEEMHQHDR